MRTIRLSWLPGRYRKPLACLALALSPTLVVLAASAATSTTVFEPAGVNAGDGQWLDELVEPAATGPDGIVVPLDPNDPVLPSDGNLQVLTITQGGDPEPGPVPGAVDDGVPDIPAVPPVGDVTPTYRLSRSGIPVRVLQSYVAAAAMANRSIPGCNIHWSLVAGIGRVESNHARFGGASVTATGQVVPPILGPRLDGSRQGWAVIRDSDNGRYDGDTRFDRAVGPMQFLPGTWKHYGADGDGDRVANPQDTDDAALGTARYLCADGTDLSTAADQWRAVMRYNHSRSYAALVIGLAQTYASGTAVPVPAPPPGSAAPPGGESGSPSRPPGPVLPPVSPAPRPVGTVPGKTPPVPLPSPGTGSPVPTSPVPSSPVPSSPLPTSPSATPSTPAGTPGTPGTTPTDTAPASPTDTGTGTAPVDTPTATVPAPTDPAPPPPTDPAPAPPPATDPAPAAPATSPVPVDPPPPATTAADPTATPADVPPVTSPAP